MKKGKPMNLKIFAGIFFSLFICAAAIDSCLAVSMCGNHCERLGSQMVCCRSKTLKVTTVAAEDPRFACRYACGKDEYQDN